MKRELALGVVLACWGCSAPCVREFPAPNAQPLGGPCLSKTECAAGLLCQATRAFPIRPQHVPGSIEVRAASACTADCADAGCPSGSACITAGIGFCPTSCSQGACGEPCVPSAESTSRICLPTCTSDIECRQLRAGRCLFVAGTGPQVCVPLVCSSELDCPEGYLCDLAGGTCGTSSGALTPSWCRRR